MNREQLDRAIREKYIDPTKRPATDNIGLEYEYPIVNRRREAVNFKVVHRMAEDFIREFRFEPVGVDDEGQIYSAADPVTGDDLSFDCSYNTVELSLGKSEDLHVIEERFRRYYRYIQDHLMEDQHQITGMGINPGFRVNRNVPVPNGRYRMLLHHLNSYPKYQDRKKFHNVPNFGLISCAAQTHIDVSEEELVPAMNDLHKIEPLKALLFANSPYGEYLCARDYFWMDSMHGLNPHNVCGYAKDFETEGEIIDYIRSMSIYCLDRDGKYINFAPTPLEEYYSSERITGEFYNGDAYEVITFEPRPEDLAFLRSYKFVDLTFRGTLELRSLCEQPAGEAFAAPAFHAGLKAALPELHEFLVGLPLYRQGYSVQELRELFVWRSLPDFADSGELSFALTELIGIAETGLRRRGYGEVHYLDPLRRRAKEVLSPAREMETGLASGKTLQYYMDAYAAI